MTESNDVILIVEQEEKSVRQYVDEFLNSAPAEITGVIIIVHTAGDMTGSFMHGKIVTDAAIDAMNEVYDYITKDQVEEVAN